MAWPSLSLAPSPQPSSAIPGLYQTLVPLTRPDPDPPHGAAQSLGLGLSQCPPAALFLTGEVGPALFARTCPAPLHGVLPLLPDPSPEGAAGPCNTLALIAFSPDGQTNCSAI